MSLAHVLNKKDVLSTQYCTRTGGGVQVVELGGGGYGRSSRRWIESDLLDMLVKCFWVFGSAELWTGVNCPTCEEKRKRDEKEVVGKGGRRRRRDSRGAYQYSTYTYSTLLVKTAAD